jgi:hypothetical protein
MQISTIEIILLVLIIILAVTVVYIYKKLSIVKSDFTMLTKDVRRGNLEDLLRQHLSHIAANDNKINELISKFDSFTKYSKLDLRKIGFRRFNPFHETGGNQSFILALLDSDNNGVILSSLHQRDVTRLYAKEIKNGNSEHKLSEEETEVLNETIKKK